MNAALWGLPGRQPVAITWTALRPSEFTSLYAWALVNDSGKEKWVFRSNMLVGNSLTFEFDFQCGSKAFKKHTKAGNN